MNTNKKSLCIYCGLPTYGRGCKFAPHGIHVHPTPDKCMYCGLKSIGRGCKFAPGGIHVRFSDFGFIQREDINTGFIIGYILNELSIPIINHPAYKIGLINEEGKLLRVPSTDQEKQVYTPIDSLIIDLKRRFKRPIDLTINESLFKCSMNKVDKFNPQQYSDEIDFKSAIEHIAEQFYNIIELYSDKLSKEKMDQYITESFINNGQSNNR